VTPPTENKVSTPVAPSKGKLGLPLSSKYNIASIPKKEELQSQVNEESAQTNDSVSQLTQENLDATWKAYYEDSILIKVGSTMGKGMVQQEYELMNFIRINLNHPKLILEVEIDTTKVPVVNKPKPTKLSSPAEKYNKIIEINPMVEELRKRFDLKMDKDN
jgi:hypothetical protein